MRMRCEVDSCKGEAIARILSDNKVIMWVCRAHGEEFKAWLRESARLKPQRRVVC